MTPETKQDIKDALQSLKFNIVEIEQRVKWTMKEIEDIKALLVI